MNKKDEKQLKEVMDIKDAEQKLIESKAAEHDKMIVYLDKYLKKKGYITEIKNNSGLVKLALALVGE